MMWGNYGMQWWGLGFGGLVLVGLVILAIMVVRMFSNPGQRPTHAPGEGTGGALSPKQILDERYARGELTSKEYRERIATLGLKP